MPALQTEDLLGVEIVRAGGPFFGTGSAPEGDYIGVEDLHAAAASFGELRDELWSALRIEPRGKLGHNDAQDAAREEGFLGGDGAPAVGWLDNLRVEDDRLLTDLRGVPRMVAALIRAGAYRARSIEFWRGYRDQHGKRHPLVITGLALLGARLPAVRGLSDLVKLYAAKAADGSPTVALVAGAYAAHEDAPRRGIYTATPGPRAYAVSDVWLPIADPDREWDEDEARSRVLAWAGATEGATNGTDAGLSEPALAKLRSAYLWWADGGGSALADFRFLLCDVVDGHLYVVPAAVYAAASALDGAGLVDPDLTRVRRRLGELYGSLGTTPPWGGLQGPDCTCGHDPCVCGGGDEWYAAGDGPDTNDGGMMPQHISPELRAALGVGDDADEAAVIARATELSTAASAGEQATTQLADAQARVATLEGDQDSRFADLEAKLAATTSLAEQGQAAQAELAAMRKDRVLDKAVADKRITPAQREEFSARYDEAPAAITAVLEALSPRTDLASDEAGHDGKGTADEVAQREDDEHDAYTQAFQSEPREDRRVARQGA